MDKQKIDRHDQTADEANETIELFGERLDAAAPCAADAGERDGNETETGERAFSATERIDQAVTAAAERTREKTEK